MLQFVFAHPVCYGIRTQSSWRKERVIYRSRFIMLFCLEFLSSLPSTHSSKSLVVFVLFSLIKFTLIIQGGPKNPGLFGSSITFLVARVEIK